jgi:hypothetical protein
MNEADLSMCSTSYLASQPTSSRQSGDLPLPGHRPMMSRKTDGTLANLGGHKLPAASFLSPSTSRNHRRSLTVENLSSLSPFVQVARSQQIKLNFFESLESLESRGRTAPGRSIWLPTQ